MVQDLREIKQLQMFKPPKKAEKEKIKKKVKSRFDGRLLIAILFLLTLLASFFFYLQTELPLWLQDFLEPKVIISNPPH